MCKILFRISRPARFRKQITNFRRIHLASDCCISETAFPAESNIVIIGIEIGWVLARKLQTASGPEEAGLNSRTAMKKILLGTVGVSAVGIAAPASAADVAAGP